MSETTPRRQPGALADGPIDQDTRATLPLAADDLRALRAMMELVTLKPGTVLHHAGEPARYVYLIETGLVAVSRALQSADAIGVQILSRGDMTGLASIFTEGPDRTQATVLVGGRASRIKPGPLRSLCQARPGLAMAFAAALADYLRDVQAELLCCAHHSVGARLARLLLAIAHRLGSDRAPVTQEQLGLMLGVQRTTISALASRLKAAKVIGYLRGTVRITDPPRLEAIACGCTTPSAGAGVSILSGLAPAAPLQG